MLRSTPVPPNDTSRYDSTPHATPDTELWVDRYWWWACIGIALILVISCLLATFYWWLNTGKLPLWRHP